jgi:hypothetical protein
VLKQGESQKPRTFTATITITSPHNGDTVPAADFTARGDISGSFANAMVLCYIKYPDGTTYPDPPAPFPAQTPTSWSCEFMNAPTTSASRPAQLIAQLPNPNDPQNPFSQDTKDIYIS